MFDVDAMIANHMASRHKYENDEGGIESNEGVHCPHCGHFETSACGDFGQSGVYADGEHDFTCQDCNADFIVETRIEHTWVSTKATSS